MKVKAVITKPDRHNEVRILKKKDLKENVFHHRENAYIFDPDRIVITGHRRMKVLWRVDYATCYYIQGMAKPLPYPNFDSQIVSANGTKGAKRQVLDFPRLINQGVTPGELAQIFNPFFYRTISRVETPWFKDVTFWCALGAFGTGIYISWKITGIEGVVKQLHAMVSAMGGMIGAGGN